MIKFLIICPMVFLAGFVDAIAGGGGLISLPAYLFAGLPVHNAIATNKLSSAMGTTVTTIKFAKNGYIKLRQIITCVIAAIIGSSIGARVSLTVDDYLFKIIMLVLLPFIAFYVLRKKTFIDRKPYSETKTIILSTSIAFVLGVYDGFYGPGTGTFLILLLTAVAHMELTRANGTAKSINLATNYASLAVYLISGKVIVLTGLIAGVFNIAGNYLGARLFESKGAKFVKPIMLIVIAIYIVKLLTEIF
ncbi:MAG: TSUP family transporter [Lachnospiraceae bacterium]|nr:TSUP family transporter [Lachnospiraceae bacterium]